MCISSISIVAIILAGTTRKSFGDIGSVGLKILGQFVITFDQKNERVAYAITIAAL